MSDIEGILDDVEAQLSVGQQAEPDRKLSELVENIGNDELTIWKHDIYRIADKFMPKRRKKLYRTLDSRLSQESGTHAKTEQTTNDSESADVTYILSSFEEDLRDLADAHIFQWSTYYRDCINTYFTKILNATDHLSEDHLDEIKTMLVEHSSEIFKKGYHFRRQNQAAPQKFLINKTLSGLERFLELPLEAFVSNVQVLPVPDAARAHQICSSMLSGVIIGYIHTKLGPDNGASILPRMPLSWINALAFLTPDDAEEVFDKLEPGRLQSVLSETLLPVLKALGNLERHITDYFPAVVLAEVASYSRVFDLSIQEPPDASEPKRISVQVALDERYISTTEIDQADRVGVTVLVAPLRPDIEKHVHGVSRQSTEVINSNVEDSHTVVRRIEHALDESIHARRSQRGLNAPITYNFAKEFPLRDPQRRRFYHVPRTSVRDLMKIFERRNGIRLWCSARRSGKTTACFDLTGAEGQTVVISQTCDSTDPHLNANHFFDSVVDALESGAQIERDFVIRRTAECAAKEADRYVLVIDEYETLFHRLRVAIRRDPDVRYTVVQPLLNQLVSFSQENLLVFLGQQPSAHYIMMDQNQLSAYVQQDPFPLFVHQSGTTVGEFSELIRKVFTTRIAFDGGFADSLFEETAGHPFLTVNVLVELVEWLIEKERPRRNLKLYRGDFEAFQVDRLSGGAIRLSNEYEFFRQAISEAISEMGWESNAWLFAAYSLIRRMSRSGVEQWHAIDDVRPMVEDLELEGQGYSAEELVRSLSSANFLEIGEGFVRPKIRILARIAETVRPRVH